jgi:hypothetical protein
MRLDSIGIDWIAFCTEFAIVKKIQSIPIDFNRCVSISIDWNRSIDVTTKPKKQTFSSIDDDIWPVGIDISLSCMQENLTMSTLDELLGPQVSQPSSCEPHKEDEGEHNKGNPGDPSGLKHTPTLERH